VYEATPFSVRPTLRRHSRHAPPDQLPFSISCRANGPTSPPGFPNRDGPPGLGANAVAGPARARPYVVGLGGRMHAQSRYQLPPRHARTLQKISGFRWPYPLGEPGRGPHCRSRNAFIKKRKIKENEAVTAVSRGQDGRFNGGNLAGVASGSERGSRKCSMINRTTQTRSDQQFPGVLQEPSTSRQPGVPLRQLGPDLESLISTHPALIQGGEGAVNSLLFVDSPSPIRNSATIKLPR
jgi:hypothetical protein